MAYNKPYIEDNSQKSLVDELKNTLHNLFIYTGNENNIDLSDYKTVLIDFEEVVESSNEFTLSKVIDNAIDLGKKLVLLNVNSGKYLSKMIGIGFRSKCMLIKPYDRYNVLYTLDLYEKDIYDCGESYVKQNSDGSRYFNIEDRDDYKDLVGEFESSFEKLSIEKQAQSIELILYSDFNIPPEFSFQSIGNPCSKSLLPKNQFKLNYLVLESKWKVSDQQITNNSVVIEIYLIASYNPDYKYLIIRIGGAGFCPANGAEMEDNGIYNRGYFQSNIKIHMEPNTDKLRSYSTEPKNICNCPKYITSCSFNVGVDTSKNPVYNKAYTISESITTTVSDFNIYNNSTDAAADWDLKLNMTENSIWDMFDEEFMKKAKVKPIPKLAAKRLKVVTEAVWLAENNLNETLAIQLYWKVEHYHCYVTGNWENYTQHFQHRARTVGYQDVPIYIDFSSVYA